MAPMAKVRNRLAPLSLGLRHILKYSPLGPIGDDDLGDPEGTERIWCYDVVPLWGAGECVLLRREVVENLSKVRLPVLIFQGRRDAQLAPESAPLVYDTVSSADKTLIWLENSGHNLLVDGEREMVWSQSYDWMLERMSARAE
jgi:carboxylesterase